MGGFQLLDLHDFPGQGTALVGVLDAFWDSKGYVTRRGVPTLLRLHGTARPARPARLHDIRDARGGHRGRALRSAAPGRREDPVAARGRRRGNRRSGLAPGQGRADRQRGRARAREREPREARRPAPVSARRRARGHAVRERLGRLGLPAPRGRVRTGGRLGGERARRDDDDAVARRRPRRPAGAAWARPWGRPRQGRARLLEHLLEHRLDGTPGAAHPRRAPRPEAPRARGIPDRGPQQLAVVAPRHPCRGDDPRRSPEGAAAHGSGDRRLVHEPAARPRLRGARGEGARSSSRASISRTGSKRTRSPARCATASCATRRAIASRRRSR